MYYTNDYGYEGKHSIPRQGRMFALYQEGRWLSCRALTSMSQLQCFYTVYKDH